MAEGEVWIPFRGVYITQDEDGGWHWSPSAACIVTYGPFCKDELRNQVDAWTSWRRRVRS